MSKEEIFNYFYTNSANLGVHTILLIMLAALVIGFIIYFTYYVSYKGVAYNSRFNASLIITLLISVVIMLMISSNIVISLGMVGALSIVRFRTAIKDSRDTIFIFWAIAEGLSVGSQNFKLALITTLFIAIVIMIMCYIPKMVHKYLLVISGGNEKINMSDLEEAMKPYILNSKLRTANKSNNSQEMIFELKTKNELDLNMLESISKVKGVESVNWISESGETVG